MKTMNWKPVQDFRNRRAASILEVLEKSGAIEAFGGEIVIDLGSGQGEIPWAISQKAKSFFIGVDKYSDPSEKVRAEAEGKFLWRGGDAIEYLQKIESNSAPIITAFYFLQALPPDKQVELLQEIKRVIRPGGRLVIIEEYKRGWPGRWIDIAMNKFLNVFNKQRYEIYSEKTWDDIFEIAGEFPIPQISYKFGRNSKLFVFQF